MRKILLLTILLISARSFATTKYFVSGGSNSWKSTNSWSTTSGGTGGAGIPTSSDAITFDANSPTNCKVDTSVACASLTASAYADTFTLTNGIAVSGNVTLGSSNVFTGSGGLTVKATSTLNFNGVTFPNSLTFNGGTFTATLSSNTTIGGSLVFSAGTVTLNGAYTINVGGGLTVTTTTGAGAAKINLDGKGTWSGAGYLQDSLTINTSDTITLSGTVNFANTGGTPTLTYTAGTLTAGSSTLNIGGSCTLNINSMRLNNLSFSGTSSVTLGSNFTINGNMTFNAPSSATINGSTDTITVSGGNLVVNAHTGTGTALILVTGSGTWSGMGMVEMNLDFNATGTETGTVEFTMATLRLGSGNNWGTATLNLGGDCSISSGSNLYNVSFTLFAGGPYALLSDITVTGTLLVSISNPLTFNGTHNLYVSGNLTVNSTISSGTAPIILNGKGTWSGTGTIATNLIINTSDTITISGNVYYSTDTLKYVAGTVADSGSALNIASAATYLDLNNLQLYGFVVAGSGYSVILKSGFSIKNNFSVYGATSTSHVSLVSSVPGTQRALTLLAGASQEVGYANATDINSSGGETILSFQGGSPLGTFSNSLNWKNFTAQLQQHSYTTF